MAIQKGEFDYPAPYWDDISPEAIDLIDKLLVVDPTLRLSAANALNHPWLAVEASNLRNSKLVHFVPNMRAFNARRRLRGAMRVIALATQMKKEVDTLTHTS